MPLFQNLPEPWIVWILTALTAGILEIILPSFTFFFVALGAIIAAIFSIWFGTWGQAAAFVVAMGFFLWLIRPFAIRKYRVSHAQMPGRGQALLGAHGQVIESIDSGQNAGRVLVQGEDWMAQSDQAIEKGARIEVCGTDGIVLKVKIRESL